MPVMGPSKTPWASKASCTRLTIAAKRCERPGSVLSADGCELAADGGVARNWPAGVVDRGISGSSVEKSREGAAGAGRGAGAGAGGGGGL